MNMKFFALLWSILFLSISYGQDPNFHIYLAFGQSNMSGQAEVTNSDKIVDSRFMLLRAANHSGQTVGEFFPGVPPMGHSQSKMGIADFFGRKMIQELPSTIKIAIANISIGGQSIDLFDKATNASYISKARSANEWWIQYLDEYGGDPYKRIIEMGTIAKREGVIKGILFHQGEADYQMSNWPSRVKKVYDDIIADLDLDPTKVPILIGELATTAAGGDLGYRNDAVAEAANLIPNGHLISAAGCPALKEASYTLHFTREGYQTFGERYAEKMLELLNTMNGPVVELNVSSKEISDGDFVNFEVSASTEEGSIVAIQIKEGDVVLGESTSSSLSFDQYKPSLGTHLITAIATDSEGNQGQASVTIQVHPQQTPYNGVAWAIPGKIEFEHYDECGSNCAYYDDSTGNKGGANFRIDEDVDLEDCSDDGTGYNLGWATSGEWVEYTVDVKNSGTYDLVVRAATENENSISITSDGEEIVKDVAIPSTGGWQVWQDVLIKAVPLNSGRHVLRVTIGSDYVNLNYMEFSTNTISVIKKFESKMQILLSQNRLNVIGAPVGSKIRLFDIQGLFLGELSEFGGILPDLSAQKILVSIVDKNGKILRTEAFHYLKKN